MSKISFYKIKKSLRKRKTGINLRREYLNSAVLLPLVLIDDKLSILFEKRHEDIRQGGEVSFPGGRVDEKCDKTSLEAALRETSEELGIAIKKIKVIGTLDTIVSPAGGIIEAYVGILKIASLDDLNINKSEVDDVFTIPLSYFQENKPDKYYVELKAFPYTTDEAGNKKMLLPVKEIGLQEVYSKPWGGAKYSVYVYDTPPEIVWGITARFILDFVERLNSKV